MCHSFRAMVAQARRRGDLYFAALLPEDHITRAFGAARARWQGWGYTPAVTVWVFLSQCFSRDHSCRDALLAAVATHVVGHRPDRFEPRLRKRRPKPYKHLCEPRRNYKPCTGK